MNKKYYLISTLSILSLMGILAAPVSATEQSLAEQPLPLIAQEATSLPAKQTVEVTVHQTNEQLYLTVTGLTSTQETLSVTLRNTQTEANRAVEYTAYLQEDQTYRIDLDAPISDSVETAFELVFETLPDVTALVHLPANTQVENKFDAIEPTTNAPEASTVMASPARATATIEVSEVVAAEGRFTVTISDIHAPNGIKEILVPVWSEVNGQNDLKWYTATKQVDGSYSVTVSASDHRYETGVYKAHVYLKQQDDSQVGLGATSVDIKPTATDATVYTLPALNGEGTMDIIITNVNDWRQVKKVLVPVWATQNGQDDLVWYEASLENDGSYSVSVSAAHHKRQTGTYNVHIYYQTADGKTNFVTSATDQIVLNDENRTQATALAALMNYEEKTGHFDLIIHNVYAPHGVKKVLVPIWSQVNGQNDLVWYEAKRQLNGTYKVSTNLAKHKYETGTYHAHMYIVQENNQQVFAGQTSEQFNVTPPTGTAQIVKQDNQQGRFEIVISDVSNGQGVKEVLVPVWADQNGQDDLVWYRATLQEDGTYRVAVEARNHRFQTGKYNVHVYYVQSDKRQIAVTTTTTTVAIQQNKPSASAIITNINDQAATFDVVIRDVFAPKGFREILVPIWSTDKGQNDLRWYTATKQADQSYKVSVKLKDHYFEQGEYNAHVYFKTDRGLEIAAQITGIANTPMPSTNKPGWYKKNGVKYFYNNAGQLVGDGPSKKLIDVSRWQGIVDWDRVAKEGDVDGVIVSLGRGTTLIDQQTARNIKELNRLNIPYGVYLYTYATSKDEAIAEARHTASLLKQYGAKLTYPIYYDVENWQVDGQAPPPTDTQTWVDIVNGYIDELKRLGYQDVHVYSYRYLLQTRLNHKDILKHVNWVAAYQPTLGWNNPYYSGIQGWQYSDKGSIPGIKGNVDLNVWYHTLKK